MEQLSEQLNQWLFYSAASLHLQTHVTVNVKKEIAEKEQAHLV